MDHAQACRLLQRTAQKHGLEELPLAQGQGGGQEERGQGSSQKELPHVQGAVATWAQEG